jgi:transcriptional regulator with XRE-family HTH domain
MKQLELAEASGVAIHVLGAIERGQNFYALDRLYALALIFADGDKEQAGVWLYRMIAALGYPLHAPAEEQR